MFLNIDRQLLKNKLRQSLQNNMRSIKLGNNLEIQDPNYMRIKPISELICYGSHESMDYKITQNILALSELIALNLLDTLIDEIYTAQDFEKDVGLR